MLQYGEIIAIVGLVSTTAVIIAAMNLLAKHKAAKNQPPSTDTMNEVLRRLERMEQMIETTGVEVERLGESNRFMSKLLNERGARVD